MVPGCLCAGHPAGDWEEAGRQGPDEPPSSSSPLHPSFSLLSYSFALLLLSPPSSSSLPSLNGGSSLVIH